MSSTEGTPVRPETPPPETRSGYDGNGSPLAVSNGPSEAHADITPTPPTVPRPANPRHRSTLNTTASSSQEGHQAHVDITYRQLEKMYPEDAQDTGATAGLAASEEEGPQGGPDDPQTFGEAAASEDHPQNHESPSQTGNASSAEPSIAGEGADAWEATREEGKKETNHTASPVAAATPQKNSPMTTGSSSDHLRKNPLLPEGNVESDSDAADSDNSQAAGNKQRSGDKVKARAGAPQDADGAVATDVVVTGATDGAAIPSHGMIGVRSTAAGTPLEPGVSAVIQNLPNPTTAEEYYECVAGLDQLRCPLGAELSPIAKEIYGPTIPFNPTLPHTRVLGHVHSDAPNCDHKEPLQLVAGHKMIAPFFLMTLIGIYCALNTVAYYQICHWGLLLVFWILFVATIVYLIICAFTNPGIVPSRQYTKDIKDRGDVIVVRVPAPNAKKVQERQREVARQEALAAGNTLPGQTSSGGNPITNNAGKRRQNATNSGLERYFESNTGKLYPVAPLFSEEEKQYKYKDAKDNKGKEQRKEVAVVEFPLAYCWTCGMYKAPRTHHCSKCNVCVDDHDHHCPWTGCCIGRGNYKYFYMSLFCLHIKCIYIVLMSIGVSFNWMVENPRMDFADYLAHTYYLPPIIYVMTFGFGIFFTPLWLGHIYMSGMGFTTSEMLKSKFADSNYFLGVNPWDAGFIGNYKARLLSRYDCWTDTRYYYSVTIAGILEDKRIDWLLMLPPEERAKVQAAEAKQKAEMEQAWATYHDE